MENVSKIEIMLIAAPVAVYWLYVLFLVLTELSPHKGIEISKRRKIIVTSVVLVPLTLLWGLGVFDAKAVDVEVTLGAFFTPLTDYIVVIWMLCAPIALLYCIVLMLKNAYVLLPANRPNHYRARPTNELNDYNGEFDFWDEYEHRLAADEAEGIFT